ncbi:MAG: hypothetical protein ACK5M7_13470 [Draconibacterium sp.]
MGFGGSVLAMIQSLRANARPKHKAYQDWTKTEKRRYSNNPQVFFKKVSAEQLAEIKAQNRLETERERRKGYQAFALSLLIIVPLVSFVCWSSFFGPIGLTVAQKVKILQRQHFLPNKSITC